MDYIFIGNREKEPFPKWGASIDLNDNLEEIIDDLFDLDNSTQLERAQVIRVKQS